MTSASFDSADKALLQLVHALRESGYTFTTVTPASHERVIGRADKQWARDARDVFGWSLPFQPDILPPRLWAAMREAGAAVRHGEGWRSSVRVSSLDGQLFLHSAYPTSEADAVFFGPDTYRFADAIRLHLAQSTHAIRRVADIGCGAGPGAILCALGRPEATVFAADINPAALRMTSLNAALAGACNVEARQSDLFASLEGEFDFVIANPPYLVDPLERTYRHGGGPLGAGISLAIAGAASQRLTPGGTLLLYTGSAMLDGNDPFRAEVMKRFSSFDGQLSYREIDPDVFGEELSSEVYGSADRIAAVVLTMTRNPLSRS